MSIDQPQICVARQAIFDPQSRIFAHEILYRGSAEQLTAQSWRDPVETTREVIRNIVFGIGLHKLLSGVKGFLNVPHQLLDDRVLEALPANQLSLEILETAEPTWEALLACRKLRSLGFSLILDDYFGQPHLKPFLDIVDFVKVDVKQASTEDVARIPPDFHARGIQVVAEKVETEKEFELFRSLGFDYFQGFFFERPVLVHGGRIPATQVHRMKLLRLLSCAEVNWSTLEDLLSHDPTLAHRLITFVNSAGYSPAQRVDSLRRCLAMLGELETRRLLTLLTLMEAGGARRAELVEKAVMRARMMELLANAAGRGGDAEAAFLTGLFSQIEPIIGVPFSQIAPHLSLSSEIEQAILGGGHTTLLGNVLTVTRAYEAGEWTESEEFAANLGVSLSALSGIYLRVLMWSRLRPRED